MRRSDGRPDGLRRGSHAPDPRSRADRGIAGAIFLLAPLLLQRLKIPGLIGIILSGAVVGPNGLNLLARDQTIVLLGTVGLLYLMFMAGTEIDLHGFKRYRNRSLVFGSLTFLIPQVAGTAVFLLMGFSWPAAILIASISPRTPSSPTRSRCASASPRTAR